MRITLAPLSHRNIVAIAPAGPWVKSSTVIPSNALTIDSYFSNQMNYCRIEFSPHC